MASRHLNTASTGLFLYLGKESITTGEYSLNINELNDRQLFSLLAIPLFLSTNKGFVDAIIIKI